MWALCRATFLGGQGDAQCIGTSERDGFGQRLGGREPIEVVCEPRHISILVQVIEYVLFLESAVDSSALGLNCHGGISKAPTGGRSRRQGS